MAGCQTTKNGKDFGCQHGFNKMWNPDDYEESDIYDFDRFIHHLFSRDFKIMITRSLILERHLVSIILKTHLSERQIANLVNQVKLTVYSFPKPHFNT